MSQLKLYCPDDALVGDEPVVLSFAEHAARARTIPMGSARRAFVHDADDCPYCDDEAIIPLEIGHSRRANGYPIPGTGTLVGYHCDGCHAEWPA